MDAVPVDSVIEASADCSDRVRAEGLLSASLAAARGPRRSSAEDARWRLTMSVVAAAPGIKAADARIVDDRGRLVAERTVSDRTRSCVALARAVGAWAQIVLDDELVREHDEEAFREREALQRPAPEPGPIQPIKASAPLDTPADTGVDGAGGEPRSAPGRSIEIGTMLFLRNGAAATGGAFGVSPFVAIAFADTWVLRPSLMYGASTSRVPPDASNSENFSTVGGRLDVCRRMPGNYIDSRGIEFDACVGGDATHVWSDRASVARGSLGPSAVLRGELGYDFGLEIRSMVGVNLSRAPFMSAEE
ncbi:MAG: hypothetical protein KF850_42440, partial [Labilithrix sp.]|nr:hypothetical protein [Labilithrix sp.]